MRDTMSSPKARTQASKCGKALLGSRAACTKACAVILTSFDQTDICRDFDSYLTDLIATQDLPCIASD